MRKQIAVDKSARVAPKHIGLPTSTPHLEKRGKRRKNSQWRLWLTRLMTVAVFGVLSCSVAYWTRANPVIDEALFVTGLAVAGFGAAGRAWASSYIAGKKQRQLVTSGPYSMCRNPLYLFSLLLGIGIALCSRTFTIPVAVAIVLAVLYHFQINQEEKRLAHKFGEEFQRYRTEVPRFFPSLRNYREPEEICISPKVFKRSLFGIAFLLTLIGALDVMQGLHLAGYIPVLFRVY